MPTSAELAAGTPPIEGISRSFCRARFPWPWAGSLPHSFRRRHVCGASCRRWPPRFFAYKSQASPTSGSRKAGTPVDREQPP